MMPPINGQLKCALDGDLGVVSGRIAMMVKNNGGQYSTIGRTFGIAFALTMQGKPGIL
jgi:hypothetical protein